MIQLTSPFRPHRAKNQSPVNRRATLLGARVSSVEAEPEKAAQVFGLTAATGQATVTVVICESRSGVLLGTWPLKGIWALPVKKDESRGLESPGRAESCAADREPGRMALKAAPMSLGPAQSHVQFRVMHHPVCAAAFDEFEARHPATDQSGLQPNKPAQQAPGQDDRQDSIQKINGSKNLTELHQVVHSQAYVVTANSSRDLTLPIGSRSLVHLGPRERLIYRKTSMVFVGEAGQDEMLIGANVLFRLPSFQQLALGSAAIPEGRPGLVDDAWSGTLSDILHDLPPGGVVVPIAGIREGLTPTTQWMGWLRHPYFNNSKCSGVLAAWNRDVGVPSTTGEAGVPGPDLSKARRRIHRSHGFGFGGRQQNIGRLGRPDKVGETPEGALGTGCCSPGDEPVLTTTGWVAIEDLDPARDKLAGHCRPTNRMTWGGTSNPASDGFIFERLVSPYRGNLVVLATERSRTRVTPNHRVLVRLNDAFPEKWCVYLMRKGNWWRIGACVTAHQPSRPGGVGGRLRAEQGDAAWILSIHDTRAHALIAEATCQGQYGVTGLTFRSAKHRSLSDRQLANIHEEISADVQERVGELFTDTGLQPDIPLYVRGVLGPQGLKKRILGVIFTAAAGNLPPLSRYVDITVPQQPFVERNHKKEFTQPDLLQASITTEPFDGDVYGLDVPPYHHYVSGGAVVHDSSQGNRSPGRGAVVDLNSSGKGQHWGTPVTTP